MYYAEQIIDGKLYYKTHPDESWILADVHRLNDKVVSQHEQIKFLNRQVESLQAEVLRLSPEN